MIGSALDEEVGFCEFSITEILHSRRVVEDGEKNYMLRRTKLSETLTATIERLEFQRSLIRGRFLEKKLKKRNSTT